MPLHHKHALARVHHKHALARVHDKHARLPGTRKIST
jgi:hypothetical protein